MRGINENQTAVGGGDAVAPLDRGPVRHFLLAVFTFLSFFACLCCFIRREGNNYHHPNHAQKCTLFWGLC